MQRKHLKETILDQVDLYLNEDNPIRETKGSKLLGIFSFSGKEGRERAIKFKNEFLFDAQYVEPGDEHQIPGEIQLQKDLWAMLSGEANDRFNLSSGEKFRIRLLKGLCEHLGISDNEIKLQEAEHRKAMISAYTGNAAGTFMQIQAMTALLRQKMNAKNVEMAPRQLRQ